MTKKRSSTSKTKSDPFDFLSLFQQSKDLVNKHVECTESHFNWLGNFLEEAKARIEKQGTVTDSARPSENHRRSSELTAKTLNSVASPTTTSIDGPANKKRKLSHCKELSVSKTGDKENGVINTSNDSPAIRNRSVGETGSQNVDSVSKSYIADEVAENLPSPSVTKPGHNARKSSSGTKKSLKSLEASIVEEKNPGDAQVIVATRISHSEENVHGAESLLSELILNDEPPVTRTRSRGRSMGCKTSLSDSTKKINVTSESDSTKKVNVTSESDSTKKVNVTSESDSTKKVNVTSESDSTKKSVVVEIVSGTKEDVIDTRKSESPLHPPPAENRRSSRKRSHSSMESESPEPKSDKEESTCDSQETASHVSPEIESVEDTESLETHSQASNGPITRMKKRSFESIGYKTPEPSSTKMDFTFSKLTLHSYKPLILSQSRVTPKSTFTFSSSKASNQVSRSKLLSGVYANKNYTPLHGGKTSVKTSQAAAHEIERERFRQDEARRQQEKEQALLKKNQLLQLKTEEQKRKREERMQKNKEARQQIEREKAERNKQLEEKEKKLSNIAKEKEKMKEILKKKYISESSDEGSSMKAIYKPKRFQKANPCLDSVKATQMKEVTSSKPVVSVTKHVSSELTKIQKPPEAQPPPVALNSTYVALNSTHAATNSTHAAMNAALNNTYVKNDATPNQNESYEMTPYRPRSTYCNYDISDLKSDDESEDECEPPKPVPGWAMGVRFKQALINQHHKPPDCDVLFGPINYPDLNVMFTKKPRFQRRTSSAVWNTPDRSIFAIKSCS